jgi:hypothetical protein
VPPDSTTTAPTTDITIFAKRDKPAPPSAAPGVGRSPDVSVRRAPG